MTIPLSRRQFFRGAAVAGLAAAHPSFAMASSSETEPANGFDPAALPALSGEAYWGMVRRNFDLPDFVNLENGYYSPMATSVRRSWERAADRVNRLSSFYMRTEAEADLARVTAALADFAGCAPDEIVITRNTTESTDTVIMGRQWQRGDEAVISNQDYPSMVEQFDQAAARWGIVVRTAAIPLHPASDEEIVSAYERLIGPRTRLLLLTQVLNISGQVLPAAKIVAMAHRHGVEVLVDGAHAFAQLDFRIPDLGCDYFATSLHKWLGAPLGLGLLYVRRDRLANLWPLLGQDDCRQAAIRKLTDFGTRPVPAVLAVEEAIRFHRLIGSARKLARLRALKSYWADRVRALPGVSLLSPREEERGCAIACMAKSGRRPSEIAQFLWDRHRLFTVAIEGGAVHGVRITPHLFTTTAELDRLVQGIAEC